MTWHAGLVADEVKDGPAPRQREHRKAMIILDVGAHETELVLIPGERGGPVAHVHRHHVDPLQHGAHLASRDDDVEDAATR